MAGVQEQDYRDLARTVLRAPADQLAALGRDLAVAVLINSIWLSNAGKCARATAFELSGHKRPEIPPDRQAVMDLGTYLEAQAIDQLRKSGFVVTDGQRRIMWQGASGKIDGIIEKPGESPRRLLEVKSANSNAFWALTQFGARLIDAEKYPWLAVYYAQCQAYMAALRAGGLEIDACHIEYVLRDDKAQDPVAAMQRRTEILPYDADEVARIEARLSRVRQALTTCQDAPEWLREHAVDDDGKLAAACNWCDWNRLCFGPLVQLGRAKKFAVDNRGWMEGT